ncbi:MAG: hypothetical protein ACRD1K_17480 [Acidimicrobiales bacterium]
MAQPEHVPVAPGDRVRPAEVLPPHGGWRQDRPGEITGAAQAVGRRRGTPGPDQGYALTLATRFVGRLQLGPGEHAGDAIAGCLGVALRRASLFRRAPVIHDLDLAFTLWGFLGEGPDDLVEYRAPLFRSAAHHYWDQRGIADKVLESTLRLTPVAVRAQLADWRGLLVA